MGALQSEEKMSPMKRFFKYFQRFTIVHLYFVITFLGSGIILNVIQAILYYTLRYFNKTLYRKINYYLLYMFYCQLVYLLQWWSDSKVLIYLERDEIRQHFGKEHSLVLLNHSYEIDWLTVWQICEGYGMIAGFKAYLKKALQYIPPIGLMCKFGEYIFLDRSYEKDKKNIHKQINELGDYPDPVMIVLFAEGTRLSDEKLKNSQEFAKQRNLPILKHHLLPRIKGFVSTLEGMNDKIKAVYNIQVAFRKDAEEPPTLNTLLCGKSVTAHIYVNRISIDDIPKEETETAKWLYQLYEKKDRLQDIFYKTGSFYTHPENNKIKPYSIPYSVMPVIVTMLWRIILLVPMAKYLYGSLIGGEIFGFSIAFGLLMFFYFAMKYVIGITEMRKASSYGTTNKKSQ